MKEKEKMKRNMELIKNDRIEMSVKEKNVVKEMLRL
jgi:hypothetical protein